MAMKTFNVGDVLAAADLNRYCVNTGFAVKPSNTTRSSAPGFADDPDLQLPVVGGARYHVLLIAVFQSPAAAGFNFTFTGSGSNNLFGYWQNWNPAGPTIGTGAYDGGTTADLTSTITLGGTSGTGTNYVKVDGMLFTPNSGTLTFRWSQTNSNASATVVYHGSWMALWRVS